VEERVSETLPHAAAADVVLFDERATASGHRVAIATLNFEKTLNSLSLEMIDRLTPALAAWNARDDVAAVVLRGAGERAFCAGGDIQALYKAMLRNRMAGRLVDDYPDRFFRSEYALDHALHVSTKPVICFGHGVVMGGGLGLFSAARFRLVSERSRIAMPEVTIGLFPDAGASWILRGLAPAYAAFLGMTGAHMNAADALHIGLATHAIAASAWPALLDGLAATRFDGSAADDAAIAALIDRCPAPVLDASALVTHRAVLERALPTLPDTLADAVERLRSLPAADAWLARAVATLSSGCPTSIGIVHEQLKRIRGLSLADVFRMELVIATHCARNADFAEGVRALIIDKDNRPAWRYGSVAELPNEYVQSHFVAPWPTNPLASLGGS
jgi:enoyl-CoA hydratase/carnithine racemase